jgi:hypothetical protein
MIRAFVVTLVSRGQAVKMSPKNPAVRCEPRSRADQGGVTRQGDGTTLPPRAWDHLGPICAGR